MKFLSFTAALLLVSSTTLFASEKPDASPDGTLSQDHTYEPPVHINKGINLGSGWLVSGDMRAGYVQYDYTNPPYIKNPDINKGHANSNGLYVIPKISITTPTISGFYAKVTGAGVTDFDLNDPMYESRTFAFGASGDPYAILQEAYLAYDSAGNRALVGAEELTTPMIDSDDWYLLANTFQLAYYTNTMLEDNMFTIGYFHKMAGVWDSAADGANYHSMSDASFVSGEDKENAKDGGIVYGAYQYNNGTHNFQIWNYYATDLYNTLFAQYDFTRKDDRLSLSYDVGLQFINFKEVGALADNDFSEIDYSLYSARFDGSFDNGVNFATGVAKYTDGQGQGSTLGAWGGYPLQNAASYKAQIGYSINDEHSVSARFTSWDLDPEYSKTATGKEQDSMNMYGVRYNYNAQDGKYFGATYEYVDLDNEPRIAALRLIGGYKF